MNSIDGIEADYDAGKMSVDEACRKLREAGLAALIWTTPSHAPEAPRYRILCPTSKELPVSGRKALIARLNGVLGGVLDGASFTDSQAMSFGHLIENEASQMIIELVSGRFIDKAAELDAGAIGTMLKKGTAKVKAKGTPLPDFTRDDAERVLADIPAEYWDDYHNWYRALCAMHYQFDGSQEAFDLVTQYSRQSDRFDELGQREKWDSITHETDNPVTMASLIAIANEARRELVRRNIPNEFDDDEEPAPAQANNISIATMNQRHAVVMNRGKTFIATKNSNGSYDFGTERDLNTYYKNKFILVGEIHENDLELLDAAFQAENLSWRRNFRPVGTDTAGHP